MHISERIDQLETKVNELEQTDDIDQAIELYKEIEDSAADIEDELARVLDDIKSE